MTSFPRSLVFAALLLISCKLLHAQKSINDFSRLNETPIQGIVVPQTYTELTKILANSQAKGLKISVAGSRHSQGGHAFYPHGLVIRLDKLNKVISLERNLLTVQTGITWKEVQEYLNPKGLAVKVMQFANFFTGRRLLERECQWDRSKLWASH